MVCQIAFLALLVNYLVYPPQQTIFDFSEGVSAREGILSYLSLSLGIRLRYAYGLPFLLVFAAFVLSFPLRPHSDGPAFLSLLIALFIHIFQLHTPHTFSPLLMLYPQYSLPVASLFYEGFARVVKLMLFFVPALLFSIYLLSHSLAETFFTNNLSPTPMATRSGFFVLVVTTFSIVICAFFMVVTMASSGSHTEEIHWDRFSSRVGLRARRCFANSVVFHGTSPFPAPFNILHILLIGFPRIAYKVLHVPDRHLGDVERWLWRTIVGPFIAILALLFRLCGVW